MMLAWFSSAMALLVERGNIDVLMLYLVWAAFYYSEKRKDILTGNVLASLASILKIYPLGFQVALAASQYKEYSPRLARIIGVAFLGGFCLYFLLTYQQIQVMTANYPKFNVTAFGLLAFNYPNLFTTQLNAAIVYLMYSIATTIVIFSVWPLWKNHQVVDIDRTQSLIGVSLFLFVVVFSINYDYRLVMLLTTIPLFLEYFRRQGTQRWVGIGFACVFLFLMNIHFIEKQLGALTHSPVTLPLMLLYAKSFTVALLFGWFGLHLVYPFVQNLFTGVENESPIVTNV